MEKKPDSFLIILWSLILALTSPLILIPLEKILHFPYILEEIAKALLILLVLELPNKFTQFKLTMAIGFLFAFSENMFYVRNFLTGDVYPFFWQRFPITTLLHITTCLIILIPAQINKKYIIPSTIVAMLVHYFFNLLIPNLF